MKEIRTFNMIISGCSIMANFQNVLCNCAPVNRGAILLFLLLLLPLAPLTLLLLLLGQPENDFELLGEVGEIGTAP